jgi:RNase P/RNase MRP subunit p29
MHPRTTLLSVSAALVAGLAATALADTVTLKNGRELHGRLVEETADSIVLRTGTGGRIVVVKEKIATFTENADWGDEQGGRATRSLPSSEGGEGEGEGETEDGAEPGPQGEGGAEEGPAADWKWPAGLTRDEIAELTKIRDDLLAELDELGPSADERMKAIDESQLSAGEKREMGDLYTRMGFNRQRRSSAAMVRRGAKDRLVSEFGNKAIPSLIEAIDGGGYWHSRMAAQAVGQLASGGEAQDARWYCYHLNVPAKLIKLMGHQGEFNLSPSMRGDANEAMEKVTGHSVGFKASDETLRTQEETRALKEWRTWWSRARAQWKKEEAEKEARRDEIADALDQLKKGEIPEGYGDEDDPLGD